MTVQELYPYIKQIPFVLVELDGSLVPSYDRHKFMYRNVDQLGVSEDILFVYLSEVL
jgi:hypothetical protein